MRISLDTVLPTVPNCAWAHSSQYFSDTEALSQVGFIGLFDTDVFIQTSFVIQDAVPLSGAIVQTFTKDNQENQNFVVYALPVNNIITYEPVKIDLVKQQVFSMANMHTLLKSFPWVSFIVFNLFLLLLPGSVGTFFHTLDVIALVITFLVFAYRLVLFAVRVFRSQHISVAGKTVTYTDQEDQYALHAFHLEALQPLVSMGIPTVVIHDGKLYAKQAVAGTDLTGVSRALAYLSSPQFYSAFQ